MNNNNSYSMKFNPRQIQNNIQNFQYRGSGLGNMNNTLNAIRGRQEKGRMNEYYKGLGDVNAIIPEEKNNLKGGELSSAIKGVDDQKLSYSMDRGKGTTDCSAFTQKVFKDTYGKDIGGWTGSQINSGQAVEPGTQKYGDLVFFNTDGGKRTGGASHVGIDNGDGTFTHFSSDNGGGVKTTPYKGYYPVVSSRRVI